MCPWFLRAKKTRLRSIFMVKRFNNVHTCVRLLKNPECITKFITWRFGNAIIEHLEISADFIQSELKRIHRIKVGMTKIYRAKKKALERKEVDSQFNCRLIKFYAQHILNKMLESLA